MVTNLLEDVSQVLGSGSFAWLGRAAGESPDVMDRAASAGLPAVLGGLSSLGGTSAGANKIMGLVHDDGLDEPNALARLGTIGKRGGASTLMAQGERDLGAIFGPNLDGVVGALGGSAHVDRSSMGGILSLLTPIALAVIGKKVYEDHLDAAGLSALLQSQHAYLAGTLPEPLSSKLGFETLEPRSYSVPLVEKRIASPLRPAATVVAPRSRNLLPLLALALLCVLGGLLVYRLMSRHVAAPEISMDTPVVVPPKIDVPPVTPPAVAVPTPTVEAPAAAPVPAPSPLDAASLATPDIRFAFRSAAMPAAVTSLDGVAAAMIAHPDARIRLTGHTDASERDDSLAIKRAQTVRDDLVSRGVPSDRMELAAEPAAPAEKMGKSARSAEDRRVDIEQINKVER